MTPEAYALLERGESSWWYVGRMSVIRRVLGVFCSGRSQRILDVGAGYGGMFDVLKDFGSVSALEPHRGWLQNCLDRGYERAIESVNDLPEEPFSLFSFFDVLEHIEDDVELLRRLRHHSPRASLIATVPANPSMWSRHDTEHAHHRRYDPKSLTRLLETVGFRVRYMSYWNTSLFLPVFLLRRFGMSGGSALVFPRGLDWFIRLLILLEARLLPTIRLPFGLSLVVYAEPVKN